METIPEALTTNTVGMISIADLAQLVETPAEGLRLLVDHKYLRVVIPIEDFDRNIVAVPARGPLCGSKRCLRSSKCALSSGHQAERSRKALGNHGKSHS
jgi:hypothetical protein